MNKILFVLLLISSFTTIDAQNINKFYKQTINSEGLLYFVFPQEMSINKSKSTVICKKELSYDYTYLDSRDTVTVLCTITTSIPYKSESVEISYYNGINQTIILRNTEILYIEPKGKNWNTRLRIPITYDEWKSIYSSPIPFSISFIEGKENHRIEYKDKKKKWEKISPKFLKLFQVIDLQ